MNSRWRPGRRMLHRISASNFAGPAFRSLGTRAPRVAGAPPRASFLDCSQPKRILLSPEICCANLGPPSKGGWAPRDQPWQPPWYIPAIRLVLRTKLLAQRGLFDDHDDCEREHPEEHTPHRDALIAEQKRFAQ